MASQVVHLDTRLESKTFPIILRTVEVRDAPHHARLLVQDSVYSAKPIDAAASERNIGLQRESAAQPTVLGPDGAVLSGPRRVNMVICTKAADGAAEQVIGLGGYGAIEDSERDGRKVRAGDVGVLLDEAFRGKGYGQEAMRLAIDWGFSPASEGGPQLDIVTITTLSDNAPMVRIAEEKLGFKGKGVRRPAGFDADKQELYIEIRPEEWKNT